MDWKWVGLLSLLACGSSSELEPDAGMVDAFPLDTQSDVPDATAPAVSITLLASSQEALAVSLDHSGDQTRVHGIFHQPISIVDGATIRPQRQSDYFAFELGDTGLVWGAAAGAPGDFEDDYWLIDNRIWAASYDDKTRVFGRADGTATWGDQPIPSGIFGFDVDRRGVLSPIRSAPMPHAFHVAMTDDVLAVAAFIEPGTSIDAGGVTLTPPDALSRVLIAAFDTDGVHLWHEWVVVDFVRSLDAHDGRFILRASVPAGAEVLGATAPAGELVSLFASFAEDGDVSVGFVPDVGFGPLRVVDGDIFFSGTSAEPGTDRNCVAGRLDATMELVWRRELAMEMHCRMEVRAAGVFMVGYDADDIRDFEPDALGGNFGTVAQLLDPADGSTIWARATERAQREGLNNIAANDAGWWLVTNVGATEPLNIDGTSFTTIDAGSVVFSRFDWSGAHLFSEVFDPPGRQSANLVGSPAVVMQYALDGDTLYAHAETRASGISDRIEAGFVLRVSEGEIRQAEISIDASQSCAFFGGVAGTCPLVLVDPVDGGRVVTWLGWAGGELTIGGTTLSASEDTSFAAGALIEVVFSD